MPVYGNGTSFVESLFETFDCDLADLREATEDTKQDQQSLINETDAPQQSAASPTTPRPTAAPRSAPPLSAPPLLLAPPSAPPLPTTPPPEDYYEVALPLSPGATPEYIVTRGSCSPPNSIEDGYEDADSNYPPSCVTPGRKNSYNDSDPLSSSYESYEEEEEDRGPGAPPLTHQWPSDESSMPPARDCRICAFLLRKKRFGQWAKQLTVIREDRLQCYKSSKDVVPYVDLLLPMCTVVYAPKDSKRKRHELRFTLPNGEGLVLAAQSKEQAHRWLRVSCVRLCVWCVCRAWGRVQRSPRLPSSRRKAELDKRLSAEKNTSDSDSVGVINIVMFSFLSEGKVKRGPFAAGRKITRIISFSKKKPPRPGDPQTSFTNPRQGTLLVLVNQAWREQWCCVCRGALHFYQDRGDPRTSLAPVLLHGCDVLPGLGPKHPFAFRILRSSTELAALEVSEELGRWLGVLLSLYYDYVDLDTIANIRDALHLRHFPQPSPAPPPLICISPSCFFSLPSRPPRSPPALLRPLQPESSARPTSCHPAKRCSSLPGSDPGRSKPPVSLKRTGSSKADSMGKTRAEEDAEKEGIRTALVVLRQERRDVKEELKMATGKEAPDSGETPTTPAGRRRRDRVDLELRLTQVKDNLKKSQAGGALGAPVEGKLPAKASVCAKIQNIYSEALPVNCATEMRKRPPSVYASTKGTVMQKAKEWESKKAT
uniref:Actin filament-associated protein 1-like 1 n=1 Tax=Gadus morhua TaxID=8049 RepID=A0A8C5ANP7_GADMO